MMLFCAQLTGTKNDLEAATMLRGTLELRSIQNSPNIKQIKCTKTILSNYLKKNSICHSIYYTRSICLLLYDSLKEHL